MTTPMPLHGSELIDCARANGQKGIDIAAQRCGYGNDIAKFELELQQACKSIGVEVNSFHNLIDTPQEKGEPSGVEIAPNTSIEF